MFDWFKRLFLRNQAERIKDNYDLLAERKARAITDPITLDDVLRAQSYRRAMEAPFDMSTVAGRPVTKPRSKAHKLKVKKK